MLLDSFYRRRNIRVGLSPPFPSEVKTAVLYRSCMIRPPDSTRNGLCVSALKHDRLNGIYSILSIRTNAHAMRSQILETIPVE